MTIQVAFQAKSCAFHSVVVDLQMPAFSSSFPRAFQSASTPLSPSALPEAERMVWLYLAPWELHSHFIAATLDLLVAFVLFALNVRCVKEAV